MFKGSCREVWLRDSKKWMAVLCSCPASEDKEWRGDVGDLVDLTEDQLQVMLTHMPYSGYDDWYIVKLVDAVYAELTRRTLNT